MNGNFTIEKILIAGSLLVIIVLFIMLIIHVKQRHKKQNLLELAENRRREEALDAVISNGRNPKDDRFFGSVPYEVDYSQTAGKSGKAVSKMMVQLVEHNELSIRKHMLSLDKPIRIGSKESLNTVICSSADDMQCELFAYKGGVFLRNLGENNRTVLRRKKKNVFAEENGLRVQNQDQIVIGNTYFDITILK